MDSGETILLIGGIGLVGYLIYHATQQQAAVGATVNAVAATQPVNSGSSATQQQTDGGGSVSISTQTFSRVPAGMPGVPVVAPGLLQVLAGQRAASAAAYQQNVSTAAAALGMTVPQYLAYSQKVLASTPAVPAGSTALATPFGPGSQWYSPQYYSNQAKYMGSFGL